MAAVVSLGLAFGAAYPRLDTQNAAQIATGIGAILYMLACLGLIALVVTLEAWPVSRLLRHARSNTGVAATQMAALLALAAVAGGGGDHPPPAKPFYRPPPPPKFPLKKGWNPPPADPRRVPRITANDGAAFGVPEIPGPPRCHVTGRPSRPAARRRAARP